jgi:drug/metabolite transporter (DMT)-like permease
MMSEIERSKLPPGIRGGLWMVASAAVFTIMTTLIREAASDIHPFEIAFFRALTNLLLMIPYIIRTRGAGLRTKNHKVYALRGFFAFTFLTTYFPGAALIPVDQSQALIFTSPIWIALLAVLLLGETMKHQRVLALLAGLAGALIILRPGLAQVNSGSVLVLAATLANAASNTIMKFTTRTDHPDTVVLYLMICVTPLISVPALFVWSWPTLHQLLLIIGVGVFATLHQRFLSRAFAAADATSILPFDFARLPFAAIIGFLVFSDLPDLWVWIGGAIIFAASIYIARHEARTIPLKTAARGERSRPSRCRP